MNAPPLTEDAAREACRKAEGLLSLAPRKQSDADLIQQAIGLYRTVLEQDFELADPYLGLAYLAFSAGDHAKAEALLVSAQTAEPADLRVEMLRQRFAKAASGADDPLPELSAVTRLRAPQKPAAPLKQLKPPDDEPFSLKVTL